MHHSVDRIRVSSMVLSSTCSFTCALPQCISLSGHVVYGKKHHTWIKNKKEFSSLETGVVCFSVLFPCLLALLGCFCNAVQSIIFRNEAKQSPCHSLANFRSGVVNIMLAGVIWEKSWSLEPSFHKARFIRRSELLLISSFLLFPSVAEMQHKR